MARPLQRDGQHALVPGARAGLTARLNLASVGDVTAQLARVLVVDLDDLVDAKRADATATESATTTSGTPPRCPQPPPPYDGRSPPPPPYEGRSPRGA